jgi:hypothetical protein
MPYRQNARPAQMPEPEPRVETPGEYELRFAGLALQAFVFGALLIVTILSAGMTVLCIAAVFL